MLKETHIKLTLHERESHSTRQRWAEGLIEQLPKDHDGRNSWLLNYGVKEEARELRRKRGIKFRCSTMSALPTNSSDTLRINTG